MLWASSCVMFRGTKVVLLNLIWRSVASAKSSRIFFRFATVALEALSKITVSSAYWIWGMEVSLRGGGLVCYFNTLG
jgi:hypothetical protein